MECDCGEQMYIDDPNEFCFCFFEGSPEVHDLARYALANRPNPRIWGCLGCGNWRPFRPRAEKYR